MKTKKVRIPLSDLLRGADEKIAKLEAQNESSKIRESDMLEAFSRIIKGADTDDYEGYAFQRKTSSKVYKTWMEVAADIGKLLAKDSYSESAGRYLLSILKATIGHKDNQISSLESEVKNLRMQIDLKNF